MIVEHEPEWVPALLPVDAAGTLRPGYRCAHQLENGQGQCPGDTFEIDGAARLTHSCVVDNDDEYRWIP